MSDYTGIPHLEVMREARNYNQFLLDLIASHAQPGDSLVDFGAGGVHLRFRLCWRARLLPALSPMHH